MRWTEPLGTAKGRERFWNQPRISIPVMLVGTFAGAFMCSLLGVLMTRVSTGSWHLPVSALLPAAIGGLLGLVGSFQQRVRVRPQAVELRSDEFSVRDTEERRMRYDQLRGFSLVQATVEGTLHRLLLLYPRTGRAFSIGIPETVTDEQIHGYLRERVPFVTINDDEALQPPRHA